MYHVHNLYCLSALSFAVRSKNKLLAWQTVVATPRSRFHWEVGHVIYTTLPSVGRTVKWHRLVLQRLVCVFYFNYGI